MLNLAISGAAGRMGARLVDLAASDKDFKIVAAIESAQHPKIGADAGLESGIGQIDVPFSAQYPDNVDVIIDFSHPAGAEAAVDFCIENQRPLVMATTGLESETVEKIKTAGHEIPICLLYTSPSPRDKRQSRMPSSA